MLSDARQNDKRTGIVNFMRQQQIKHATGSNNNNVATTTDTETAASYNLKHAT